MRHEPEQLPSDLLVEVLRERWGIEATGLEYAPVGAGSHHWVVRGSQRCWFATADQLTQCVHYSDRFDDDGAAQDAAFTGLTGALRTAASLGAGGHDFVVAPVPDRQGAPVCRVRPDWALAVYPYLEGVPAGDGDWPDTGDRVRVARMVGELHATPPPASIPRWSPAIEGRHALVTALRDTVEPWTSGPYGEPSWRLLRTSAGRVASMLAEYGELVEKAVAGPEHWVVTHGEPHSRNVLRVGGGRLRLIDWDTVALAPPERDLESLVGDEHDPAWQAYQDVAGLREFCPDRMRLFRLRWDLQDIAIYVRQLHARHAGTADDRRAYDALSTYLG